MATKGEILREYKIKINTEIGQAKKEVEGLRAAMGKKLGDNIGTEIEASMEAAEASLKSLSDTVDKRIGEMNSSLRGLKLDKLQSEMKELSDSVKESVSVVKEQVDLLTTAFNSSDPARFEQFVAKITGPLADLTEAVKIATKAINGLSDVKLATADTSGLEKTKKKVTRGVSAIKHELEGLMFQVNNTKSKNRLTFNLDADVGELQREAATIRGILSLLKELKDAGGNVDSALAKYQSPASYNQYKEYLEQIEELTSNAEKKQKPIELDAKIKVSFDASKDIDQKEITAYIDKVKEQIVDKVQEAVDKEPIKLRFGWDIETDDAKKTGDKTADLLDGADKVLYKTLKIRMEGDESRLKSNLEGIINSVNDKIKGDEKFAIKVDIVPNEPTRGSIAKRINDLGSIPSDAISSGGKVSGEVTLQGTEGLATEGTLREIRDILAHDSNGPKGPGTGASTKTVPVSSNDKNWNAAYSKVDAFREQGARNYAAFSDYHRVVNKEVESLRETILQLQKQFRFFTGLEKGILGDARDSLGIKGIPEGKKTNIGKSKLYGAKIDVNGQEFSTYARYSERFKGRNVNLKEWQDYLDSLEENDLRNLFKQMGKEAKKHRGSVQDTLRKNGVEYKWNKETKSWDQLATKASLGGDSNKSVVEKLRDQHREVVKGYEEEAAITARYVENLRERKSLAEDLVKMSEAGLDENYDENEYLVKQNRLRELTRTYKGNDEVEQAESAKRFNDLIKEQRTLIGKGDKTVKDYERIGEITEEIKTCFGDVSDIMLEAKRMLEVDEKTGKSRIDSMIEENEALFKRQRHTAQWASREYLTRSKVVNPETAGGVFSVMRAATEHKTGMKDPGSYFSQAALKPFGDSATNLLKYLDSAEEYQADLDKIAKLSSRIAELERMSLFTPSNVKGQSGTYESGLTATEIDALRRWRKERGEAMRRVATYDAQRDKGSISEKSIRESLAKMSERGVTIGNTNLTGEVKKNYEEIYSKFIGEGMDLERVIMEMTEDEFAKFKKAVTAAKEQLGDGSKEAIGQKVQETEEHLRKVLQADLDFAIKALKSEESSPSQKLQAVKDIKGLKEELSYLRDPKSYVGAVKETFAEMSTNFSKYIKENIGELDFTQALSNGDFGDLVISAREAFGVQSQKMGLTKGQGAQIEIFRKNIEDAKELANELGVELGESFSNMPKEYADRFKAILRRGIEDIDRIEMPDGMRPAFDETNLQFIAADNIQEAIKKYNSSIGDFRKRIYEKYGKDVAGVYFGLSEWLYKASAEDDKHRSRGRLNETIEVDGKQVPALAYERHKLITSSYEGSQSGSDELAVKFANRIPEFEQKRADAAAETAKRAQETAEHEDKATKSIQDQISSQKALIAAREQEIKDLEERNRIIEETGAAETKFINNLAGEDRKLNKFKDLSYADLRWKATKIGDATNAFETERVQKAEELPLLPVPGSGRKAKNPIIQRLRTQYYTDKASNPAVQNIRQQYYKNREKQVLDETQPLLDSLTSELWMIPREIIERENEYFLELFSSSDFRNAFYSEKDISSFIKNSKGFDFNSILKRILGQFDEDALAEAYESQFLSKQEVAREASLYLMASGKKGKIQNQKIVDILKDVSAPLQYDSRMVDQAAFSRAVKEITKGKTVDREYNKFIGHKYDENGKKTSERLYQRQAEKVRVKGIEELKQELADMEKEAAIEKDRETILSKYGQDALKVAEEIDVLLLAIQRLNNATGEKDSAKIAEYQEALSGTQGRAKELGLTVAKSGRAHSSKYYARFGMVGMPTTVDESKIYTEDALKLRNSIRKTAAETKEKNLEEDKALNEEIDKLRWGAVDAQVEENKVAKARAALTEQEIKDLREASKYAGMTQEQADAAFELNEFNKNAFKEGKKPTGRQLWRQAYLQEAAERTGLKISKEGNAYLEGFDRDAWMRNPFAYKGNSYTDRIFDEYKPKEYQKALDSGLALEVTQKAVLNAINSLKTEGLALKDEKPADKKSGLPSPAPKGKKKGGKPKVEVPQEVKDAQKIFRDKEYKSFADFDDAAKEAAKKAILAGRNIYTYSSKKKPELNGKYGIASNLVGKNGFSDLTKDIAKQLGIDLPDLDALRKAAEQKAVETKASAEAVVVEANATETLAEQMIAAAKAKKEFAEANNLVLGSAAESAPKVEEEAKAVEELAEKIEKLPQVDWNEISPEAQATIRAQFGKNVDVYKQGTRGKNGEANVEYRVVGEDKAGVVSESGLLDQKRVLVLNAYSKAKLDAAKAARIENAEVKAGYDTELKLMKKKRKLQAENERLAITGKDPEMMVANANAISAVNNELEGVRKNLVANEELTKRNTRELEQYEKTLVGNAELAKGEKKVADRKAAEKEQRAAQNEADKAARKAQEEADKEAKKAQDEADRAAKKKQTEAEKEVERIGTTHNKEAVAAYDELQKSAARYYELIDKKNAGKIAPFEEEELVKIASKWELAERAKRLYILADKETNHSLTQEEAAELAALRAYWDQATDAEKVYIATSSGTKESTEDVKKAAMSLDNIDENGWTSYLKSAKKILDDILDDLAKIEGGGYTSQFKAMAGALKERISGNGGVMSLLASGASKDDVLSEMLDVTSAAGGVKAGMNRSENKAAKAVSINNLLDSAQRTRKTYLGMPAELLGEYDAVIDRLKTLQKMQKEQGTANVDQVAKEAAALKDLSSRLEESGRKTAGVFGTVTNRLTDMNAKFIAQYFSIQDWIRYMRTAVTTVIDLDTALTELRKVSNETDARLAQSMQNSARVATSLGSTITDVVNATADWARLGYNVDQAEELARVSILYKNVGDNIDIDTASSSLISTMKGYQLEADQAEAIVDKFNEIGNNFAINSAEIGEALKRSAASFNASGTSLDKSIALVTAANTVAQNAESVGTTFKTLSARIRGASTELADLGEEEDEFTKTTSKLRDLVMGLTKFDIMKEDGKTFKDIYDILIGIGKEWDNLTDVERASLGEALAGKRNANILYAVLQDTDLLEQIYEKSLRSAGSAMREQENYQRSIQYSINQLKANGQALAMDFVDSGLVKGVVNVLSTIVNLLDQIISKTGGLPTVMGAFFGAGTISSAGGLQNIWNQIRQRDETGRRLITSGKTYKSHIWQEGENLPAGVKVGDITREADKDLGFWGSTGGALLKNFAITAGVTLAVSAVTSIYKAIKDGEAAANQAARNISQSKAEADSLVNEAQKLRSVLDDSSSTDSQRADARKRLLDIQNKLVEAYGNEAKNLDLINGSLDGQIERLEKLEKNTYLDWAKEYQKGGFLGIGGRSNEQIGERAYNKLQERKSDTLASGVVGIDLKQLISNISGLGVDDVNGVQSVYTTMLTPEETNEAINALLEATDSYERNSDLTQDQIKELSDFRSQLSSTLANVTSVIQDNTDAARMYAMVLLSRSGARTDSGKDVYDYYGEVEEQIDSYRDALTEGTATSKMDASIEGTLSEIDALTQKFPELRAAFDFLIRSLTTDPLYKQRTATNAVEERYGTKLQHLKDNGYSRYDAEHGLSNAFDQQDLENILAYYDRLGVKRQTAIGLLAQEGWLTDELAAKTEEVARAFGTATQRSESLKAILSSISSSGDFSGLDTEQLALLAHYEEEYSGLAEFRNKSAKQYAERLKSIQHLENEIALGEQRRKTYSESTDIADYGEHGATQIVKLDLDTDQATKELNEWLDADAKYSIDLTADIDLQTDQIKEKLDAMGDAFSSIGDGWKVAKDDVENFVNYLPEAAAQAEVLADGSLQLNQEIVDSAHDRLEAEISAAEGGAMADIEGARAGLQAKLDAATAARDAAQAMANAVSNGESVTAEQRKTYEESVTNAKKVCYDANQENAIDAAGTESDASKEVTDNVNENGGIMAANAASAYDSMAGSSAQWAMAAIKNANAVAVATKAAASGEVVTPATTRGSVSSNYYGRQGVANKTTQKSEMKDADTSMFDILPTDADSSQWQAQADAWNAAVETYNQGLATLNGAESKLKGARDAFDKGFGNAGKDSGSGGGGGGGGGDKDKKDEKKEIDWMERMVNLLEKQHELTKANADDEFLTYEKRIEATKELINQDEQLLGVYQKQSREYGVAYEKAYDEVRKLADSDGKLKDLWDNDVYGLGASYEELKKVNDEINSVFEKYGKRNLDYNNRPYIAGEDGSWITMLTEGMSLNAGDKEFSMVITPILESGDEINLDEYLAKIQDQINEKMANGEEITIDTVLELDKNNLIVSAAEGSWEQNEAAFDQMEAELQGLKEKAIELRFANEEGVKSLRDAVENGSLDISQFSQEVQEAIMNVTEKWDKVQESREKEIETQRRIKQEEQERFELELNMIKERQKAIENERDIMQHSIDMRETTGSEIIKESDYEDLIDNADQLADNYREQLAVLEEQKGTLDEGTAAWYNVVSQMYEVEGALRDIEKQQAEWNETIKQLPIRRIQRYLQMLENIKKDIQNFNAEEQVLGINPNQQSYTDMFEIDVEALDKYHEELDKLRENLKTYTYGTDKFEETANSIQECEDNVSSLIQEMREYNTAILNIPIDKINAVVEKLEQIKSALEEVQADNDLAINAAITLLSEQIEDYNDKISETEKLYQDRIDALQEEADANAEQLALEKARYELEKARGQLTNKILKNGEWTWTADVDQLKNAAESLDNAAKDKAISDLEKERDAIIKPMQDEVERLEKQQNKWEKLEPDRENQLNYEKATPIFGDKNWQQKVLSGNDDALWNKMDKSYNEYMRSIDAYTEQIKDYQQTAQIMSTYIQEYNKGNLTASEVTAKMGMLMIRARNGYTSGENLTDTLQAYKEVNATTALANSKPTVDALYKDFSSYMKIVEGQNTTLDKYTQTWDQIHQSVQDQLAELKRLAEIEEQKLKERRARASSGGSGGGGGNSTSSGFAVADSGGAVGYVSGDGKFTGDSSRLKETTKDYFDRAGIDYHHTGIDSGRVGEQDKDQQLKALKALTSGDSLKDDEVLSVLKKGEVVLTEDQVGGILSKLVPLDEEDMLSRFTLGKDVLNLNAFRAKKLKGGAFAGTGVQMQQNFTFGDIHVMEAQNVTDIAHGIMNGGLAQALTQQLYKR